VLAFIATIIRIPYNAAIVAHEKMGFFAWNSIIEVGLKLMIVFMLIWFQFDKLILYSILTFIVVLIISLTYLFYCRKQFTESKYQFAWEKELFKSMFSFAGWNLFASLANVGMNQGVNILLNMFFGPAINASRGIAYSINGQIMGFVGYLQMAASPQIIKYYAADEKEEMKKLYYQSSRLSYYLLFIIALPVLLEMDQLLYWWLNEVPEYTALFARLVIITTLVDCMSGTTIPVVQATGKIKYYQLTVGILIILNMPISYLFLKNGFQPEITMYISILLSWIALFVRLIVVKKILNFSILAYLRNVVQNNIIITCIALFIPVIMLYYLNTWGKVYNSLLIIAVSLISAVLSVFIFGLSKVERNQVYNLIKAKING